ncbi:trna-splicing endonuclease subunit [Ophiostoma piceae UAMH 11346]|uniref:tRNA-intron lyase n=1 Tax=Ophiostoma piceae (strain UAMH 11346) TaxID=1262450 RepID=S3C8H2_OPHP1|nr:trna-splicing endonuclease subunit [Ophiostoma piceae UAMH 11346]
MAETIEPEPPSGASSTVVPVVPAAANKATLPPVTKPTSTSTPNRPPPRQKYALPLPVRTFPLPTFYPSNPVSLMHLAVAWACQVLGPPSALPAQKVYTGTWCPATRSVNVSDPASMNDLWCQGFFGKGSLSRSEPSWLKREKERERDRNSRDANAAKNKTSEQRTTQRREERADTKWERGRAALEAIEKRKQEEAAAAEAAAESFAAATAAETTIAEAAVSKQAPPLSTYTYKPPVGPLELLALPNSDAELLARSTYIALDTYTFKPPVGPLELLALPNSAADLVARERCAMLSLKDKPALANGNANDNSSAHVNGSINGNANGSASAATKTLKDDIPDFKRQKSVRFSSTVESTTFGRTDPPSPNLRDMSADTPSTPSAAVIVNKEHLQLAPEEAFFLAYAVGALRVVDDAGRVLSTQELFWLFSEYASFPLSPSGSAYASASGSKTNTFLTHYSVYHHFRSLGWTPRHGIKFGVDWLLYGKGPALDHAEFGVMVVASEQAEKTEKTNKSWHWLHSVNRVLSTVYKSMVLVYVDVPAVPRDKDADVDVTGLLRAVKIRDVMVRRWSSNRNRD